MVTRYPNHYPNAEQQTAFMHQTKLPEPAVRSRDEKDEGRRGTTELDGKMAKLQKQWEEFYKNEQRNNVKYLPELKQLANADDADEKERKD
ncbi:hypothetical protein ACEPPN_004138 [Leptodophora sp. 'Broadleaf-Isolate-01']